MKIVSFQQLFSGKKRITAPSQEVPQRSRLWRSWSPDVEDPHHWEDGSHYVSADFYNASNWKWKCCCVWTSRWLCRCLAKKKSQIQGLKFGDLQKLEVSMNLQLCGLSNSSPSLPCGFFSVSKGGDFLFALEISNQPTNQPTHSKPWARQIQTPKGICRAQVLKRSGAKVWSCKPLICAPSIQLHSSQVEVAYRWLKDISLEKQNTFMYKRYIEAQVRLLSQETDLKWFEGNGSRW